MQLTGLWDLCISYVTINHDMLPAFVERWHSKKLSFHLPHGETFITLDDVSCLLHLPIRGRLLDHARINRDEVVEMMEICLGVNPGDFIQELEAIWRCHARFRFFEEVICAVIICDKVDRLWWWVGYAIYRTRIEKVLVVLGSHIHFCGQECNLNGCGWTEILR